MSDGIVIKVEQGDKKIEIKIGKDVNPEQLKVVQKVLEKFAESTVQNSAQAQSKKDNESRSVRNGPSRFFKVKTIIATYLSSGQWFTSLDVRELYEEVYKEELPPNTASTYLRRLEKNGVLKGRKKGKIVEYVVVDPSALDSGMNQGGVGEKSVVVGGEESNRNPIN